MFRDALVLSFSILFSVFFNPIPLKASVHDTGMTPGLEALHQDALLALKQSQKNNPILFDLIQQRNAAAAQNFLNDPLEDLDLQRIVGRPYSDYDSRAWAMPSLAFALFNAGLCYVQPDNRWYQDKTLLAKSEAGFEWILRHVTPEGTLGAPDGNIDRFTYAPVWEAFILLAPDLTPLLRERFSQYLLNAAEYQVRSYGKKKGSPIGRYPNMDTAYILIMQQAASLFGRVDFAEDVDTLLDHLADCLSGST